MGALLSDRIMCDDCTRAVLLALETCDAPELGMGDRALERFLREAYPEVVYRRWRDALGLLIELGMVERSPADRYAFRVAGSRPSECLDGSPAPVVGAIAPSADTLQA